MLSSAEATSTDLDGKYNVHHRVIADHLRSTSFLIADGVLPAMMVGDMSCDVLCVEQCDMCIC